MRLLPAPEATEIVNDDVTAFLAFETTLRQLVPTPQWMERAKSMFAEAWRQRTAQAAEVAANCKREIAEEIQKRVDYVDLTDPVRTFVDRYTGSEQLSLRLR